MDKELKQQLEWMNENLNTIAKNQALLYIELKELEHHLQESHKEVYLKGNF